MDAIEPEISAHSLRHEPITLRFPAISLEFQESEAPISAGSLKKEGRMDARELGVRIMQYRERRHLSITQLANQLGVDYMQISRYEKGRSMPSLETAVRLARVFCISLDELATGSEPTLSPFKNSSLLERMRELDTIPADRQELALRVLDTVVTGHQLDDLAGRLRRS
jgi:transcriptional regulator with XRE-family HTH domain